MPRTRGLRALDRFDVALDEAAILGRRLGRTLTEALGNGRLEPEEGNP